MRFIAIENTSGMKWTCPSLGLEFESGEVKKVSPATVKHPAVSSYIGRGLTLVTSSKGEEPKAPIPTVVTESSKSEVTTSEPMPEELPPVMDTPKKETAGYLQEAYLAAPGATEEDSQDDTEGTPSTLTVKRSRLKVR
jgi:hypothetical protein